jgi:hypothetical protein
MPIDPQRPELVVDKDAIAVMSRAALQRQSDQIAKPTNRHAVLAWKKAIIRFESDVGAAIHGLRDQMGPELSRLGCRYRFCKEDPDVGAIAGTRALESRRNMPFSTCRKIRQRVAPPSLLVKIGDQEPASLIGHERVHASNERVGSFWIGRIPSLKVASNDVIAHRDECLVRAFHALDPGLFADTADPFICARGRIARFSGLGILPPTREDIFAAPKARAKQCDLVGIGHGRCTRNMRRR